MQIYPARRFNRSPFVGAPSDEQKVAKLQQVLNTAVTPEDVTGSVSNGKGRRELADGDDTLSRAMPILWVCSEETSNVGTAGWRHWVSLNRTKITNQ
ncbi:hypothetical protein [Trinickia sp. EG282A]|uniref:hypothetical protein n=1 Tax=Trinickia sp. EG282A TaxID=3237013 RepID=UPI0034D23AE2